MLPYSNASNLEPSAVGDSNVDVAVVLTTDVDIDVVGAWPIVDGSEEAIFIIFYNQYTQVEHSSYLYTVFSVYTVPGYTGIHTFLSLYRKNEQN